MSNLSIASQTHAASESALAPNAGARKPTELLSRYARALKLTGPKIAAETVGATIEGYWIDERSFFFLAEKFHSACNRILVTPSVADAATGRIREIFSPGQLVEWLSAAGHSEVDLQSLVAAEYDWLGNEAVGVSVGKQSFIINAAQCAVVSVAPADDFPCVYSPDGQFACFVHGYNLWIKHRSTREEKPITLDGTQHCFYGQQAETCGAILAYRKRPVPMGVWSPDSQWFLTHRVDERAVPDLAVIQSAPPEGGRPVLHPYKYAIPGDALPQATYVAIHVSTGRIVAFEEFPVPVLTFSPFALRMAWFGRNSEAWVLRLDRFRQHADFIRLDLVQGTGRVIFSETVAAGYIDLHPIVTSTPNVRTLKESDEFIWFSERDGWGQLYLHDASTGALKHKITDGEFQVRDILHVDEQRREVLFLAGGVDSASDPACRSLCTVKLDGSGFRVLAGHNGDVVVTKTEPYGLGQDRPFRAAGLQGGVSPNGRFVVVRYASIAQGNVTRILDLESQDGFQIASARPQSIEARPVRFSALAADGVTKLHGVMFFPSDFDANTRYPLIDYIYPGPQIAWQPQSFRAVHAAQAMTLAELGFVTVMLDTRGMPISSRAFHQIGYGELLEPQLSDHASVIRQLCERFAFIDAERIGIIGQSGGGTAAARALFDYGHVFKVGVSVCGNHDSNYYSAVWSDRYRGPGDPRQWASQANQSAAHKLRGKLLLISGDIDENVHVSHTLSLAHALMQSNRSFEMLIVPNEGHAVLMTHAYTQRRVWDFFVQHLAGGTPPEDFEIRYEPHEIARMEKAWIRES